MLVALLMGQEIAEDVALMDGQAVIKVFHGSRRGLGVDAFNDAASVVAHCIEAGECFVALITGLVVRIRPLRVKVATIERGIAEGIDGVLDGVEKLFVFQAKRCGSSAVEGDGGDVGDDGGRHGFRRRGE
jgi:hypothetical protein